MSEVHESLTELTTEQEATIAGGFQGDFLLFQDTAIDTFADNQTSITSQAGLSATSRNRTGYRFRQTTLLFGGSEFGRNSFVRLFDLFRRFF
jgi:hypothetical protein